MLFTALTVALAQLATPAPAVPARPASAPPADAPTMVVLETGGINGLSGMTLTGPDTALAVAERARFALPLRFGPGPTVALSGPPVPLQGIDPELETEDLAFLQDRDRFAFATERQGTEPLGEFVLFGRRTADGIRIDSRLKVPLSRWGVTARPNQGLEGLCVTGRNALVAVETVIPSPKRATPLALIDLKTKSIVALRLQLTTPTGKISALACAPATGGEDPEGRVDVLAIERHYGIGRILAFRLDPKALREADPEEQAKPIVPRVAFDLAGKIDPLPNLESLVELPAPPGSDGRRHLVMVSDNDSGAGTEATRVVFVTLPAGPRP